jgi:hypothetical protein
MSDGDKSRTVIEQSRDICRARQIACVALANSDIEHAAEYVQNAFSVYRDAADALNKVLEII